MTQHKYGGRYSTNYIEDIKRPLKHVAVTEDRSGLTNFRPFEELANTVGLGQGGQQILHKKVWIDYSTSTSPINVNVLRAPAFGYTFVPPLTDRDFDWHHNANTYIGNLISWGGTAFEMLRIVANKSVQWVSDHVTAPVLVGVAAVMSLVSGTSYSIDQGVQRRWKTGVRASALTALLALCIIVGAVFLVNNVLDKATTSSRTATSSSRLVQQASDTTASNGHAATSSSNSSSQTKTAANGRPIAGQTTSSSTPSNPGATSTAPTTGSLPVGGYGGGGTVPTSPAGSILTDPVGLIPYNTVTTPPLSVSSGDKQILGTSGTTITTN